MSRILHIEDLNVSFRNKKNIQQVLKSVNLDLHHGEMVAILGETGCGKSTLAKSIIGLVPNVEATSCSELEFLSKTGEEVKLDIESPGTFEPLRGKEIGLVYQEAASHLNPTMSCGRQLMESLNQVDTNANQEALVSALEPLGFEDINRILKAFPNQLSGGECQRVLLAMAVLQNPRLLIVDEPSSSLDKPNEALIISYLKDLNQNQGTSIIFITHDISIAMNLVDRIVVIKEGVVIDEFSPKKPESLNDYTKNLIEKWERISKSKFPNFDETNEEILSMENVAVEYASSGGRSLFFNKKKRVVHDASFVLNQGDVLGIYGVSGSGKTSLAKAICGLEQLKTGRIIQKKKQRIQMVFQNPADSLDPLQKTGSAIREILNKYESQPTKEHVLDLLAQVKLTPEVYEKRPHELSGGQKQRVCIARVLASKADIIIFDEATSSLDAPIKTEILELLLLLRSQLNLTYIMITHDLSVIKFTCNKMMVMHNGEIVEKNKTSSIIENPMHPASKALILQQES